jgi:hypothetical protein
MSAMPLPSVDELGAPDLVEPVRAWRTWLVRVERGAPARLRSVVFDVEWKAREPVVAECLRPRSLLASRLLGRRHEVPRSRCSCGVYGADAERALSYLSPIERPAPAVRVIGLVALWGFLVECKHGWRASHAYPLHLYLPRSSDNSRGRHARAEEIALGLADYGVPVELVGGDIGSTIRRLEAERSP